MSSVPIRFSTISPVANTSPVVSTAVISMTTIIEMIAATANFGPAEVERRGHAEPRRAGDGVEVRVAERPGHQRADDQADQHGDGGHEALEHPLDQHDEGEGAQRVGQVLAAGRVRGRPGAARGVGGRHRQQRDADDRDDRAGDHRREEPDQLG